MGKADSQTDFLFPELRRKHRQLFIPKRLTQVVFELWGHGGGADSLMLEQAQGRLKHWATLAAKGALAQKETSLDHEFLRIIFAEGLGYVSRGNSTDVFQLDRQYTVEGCGTADGALGFFCVGKQPRPVAVIECKGASVDLDHDKSGGRTPVQQLWDYLAQLPDTPWGILSNYITVRLYHRDATPRAYHEWTVKDFLNPDRVREFVYLLNPDGLLGKPPLQKPRASAMLELSATKQREVGDDLYEYYSEQREHLIESLISQHHYATDSAIRAAQLLLDRIVFIAFCQYRGLLPARLLENTWKNVAPLARATNPRWQNFLDCFHAIDKGHRALDLTTGYNGGLFRKDPLVDELQLEDEPFTTVFKNIGDYDFSESGEVNVDVLGHLFEKSITELEKRKAVGLFGPQASVDGVRMPKSAERKRFGIYYTPPQFTRFIVDRTVGRLIEQRVETSDDPMQRVAALRKLRVVDPACGSGAFLIAAYERIEEAYDGAIHLLRVAGRSPEADELTRRYPEQILADNLFGMDLSEEAVEITRLALWIRSARKGTPLSDLSHNIICGNSLVSDRSVHARATEWSQAFPAVFAGGGFDCVIGNPPWERLKLQEREFFALSAMEIASAVNAADRRKLIERLETKAPELYQRYSDAKAVAERTLAYVRDCGRFPHTGRGDVNTYMLFAELSRQLVAPDGLIGLLVPSGIATDDTTKHFFVDLMEKKALCALYDFENKQGVFADVHRAFKFSVLLMNGRERQTEAADFVFFAHSLEDLDPRDRHITLSARDLKLLNPNTRTCPIFRSRFDCEITKRVYRSVPILVDNSRKSGGNPWGIRFVRMFDQTNDAELFRDAKSLEGEGFRLDGNRWVRRKEIYLPLYEAKMIQAYDHRAAGIIVEDGNWVRQGQTEETPLVYHQNPEFSPMPRFWIAEAEVMEFADKHPALLAFKDITSPTNQRTMIAAFVPRVGLVNSAPFIVPGDAVTLQRACCLLANLNAFAYDFVARQKVGGLHLNFFIVEQLPTFPPSKYDEKCPWDKKRTLEAWISERVLKLTCTADDMRPLAEAAGFKEGVHKWSDPERIQLRAELDAAYFILYGFTADEINDVLDGFNGVVKEDDAHGRPGPTRRAILDAFHTLNH